MKTDLFVREWGSEGERIVFLHGILTASAESAWEKQKDLAERHQLIVPDRRNYGQNPLTGEKDFEVDVQDTLALLDTGGHLVGHSHGAILGLLTATRRPDLVKSLVMVEPALLTVTDSVSAVVEYRQAWDAIYNAIPTGITPEAFYAGFCKIHGIPVSDPPHMLPARLQAVKATMLEPRAWHAPIDYEAAVRLSIPKLVVSGGWHPAFEAICETLAERIKAERVILPGAGHTPQNLGKPFNDQIQSLLPLS